MVACPDHILESTIKFSSYNYIDVDERKCRRQEPYSYLTFCFSYISLIFSLKVVFCVMSWCASGIVLQVLPFIDNRYLGNIHRFQRFSCCCCCS